MTATILTINAKSSKLTSAYNNSQSDRLVACLINNTNNNNINNNKSNKNKNINDNINASSPTHHHRPSTKKLYHQIAPTHHSSLNRPIQHQTKKPSPSIELWAGLSQRVVIAPSSLDQLPGRHPTATSPPTPSSPSSSSCPCTSSAVDAPQEPSPRSPPGAPPPTSTPLNSPSSLLSFSATSSPTPFAFNFPLPTPARHSPPPYPGPRPLASIQLPAHPHHTDTRRLVTCQSQSALRTQPYTFRPSNPVFILPLASSTRKRGAAFPLAHSIRSKKIKLAHPFFRSPRLFFPCDYSRVIQPTSSCLSQLPPPTYQSMESPRWLHTSAAAEGHSSKLCPKEAQFTGDAQSWSVSRDPKPSFLSSGPSQRSTSPQCAPSAIPPRTVRTMPPPGPHAAPLKAQLLAVLRMRSNLQPGEAALRLKKWVIWNSWVRGQDPRRFYPVANPSCVNVLPNSHPRASTLTDLPGDEWTGDEMFDENGDLVCEDEELDGSEELEECSYSAPVPIPKTESPSVGNNELLKNQRMTRSKVPPRIDTSRYPSNLTPPSSPESQRKQDEDNKLEDHCYNSTVEVTNQLGQIKVSKADQKPLTPPPSPPNHTRK